MISINSMIHTGSQERSRSFVFAQIALSSLLIAFCAQISIPLPFTPVPMTLQTLAIMMVGVMLGSRNGALAVIMYIAESMLGLPVLASGKVNPLALIGPAGGYIVGFVFQAYLVGWFSERRHMLGKSTVMLGISLASALQLTVGALWLGQFVGFKYVVAMGILPYLAGEAVKIFAVAGYLSRNDNLAKS